MLNENDFPVIFTRAANVYGECQDLYRIIPKTIMKIKKNSKSSFMVEEIHYVLLYILMMFQRSYANY